MAGIRTENKIYEVGIYCRLSKDDGTDNESASIATQKSILTDYVKRQGWHLAKTYVDDGYSGTNFQRPSFQNMIKDIENGLINCVITKDLSRLGRNYLDCGLYLEVFFPEHNVRYIAVNDGVDTLNKSAMDITPFRNILNEMYSADVSVKIKSAYRARFQQGKFMGTTAPYGYVKDPADHNHLLIDDKVAHVVREIFDLALAGNGIAKIRKHINKQHILRPAAYAVEQGATGYERYFEDNEENRYIWSENSVRGILRSPIYAGNLAGYKRIAANMKSKKRPSRALSSVRTAAMRCGRRVPTGGNAPTSSTAYNTPAIIMADMAMLCVPHTALKRGTYSMPSLPTSTALRIWRSMMKRRSEP